MAAALRTAEFWDFELYDRTRKRSWQVLVAGRNRTDALDKALIPFIDRIASIVVLRSHLMKEKTAMAKRKPKPTKKGPKGC